MSERSGGIDLLKALACVLIVGHHLANYSPMADVSAAWMPQFIAFLYNDGRMAVQIFLVAAGYLTACAWLPLLAQSKFSIWPKVRARYLRLSIPLFAALACTVLITAWVRPYFEPLDLSDPPEFSQVLAHLFLLQDLTWIPALSAGIWYVAIDFQLFLMALASAVAAHWWHIQRGSRDVVRTVTWVWLGLTCVSLFYWNRQPLHDNWGGYFFNAYGLGLCVASCKRAGLKLPVWALVLGLGLLAWSLEPRERLGVAVATALLLSWPAFLKFDAVSLPKWVTWLSKISYSVFLIHYGVSLIVSAVVFNFWPEQMEANLVGMLVSLGLSIAAGALLFDQVEKPSATPRRALQWAVTFVAACTAVKLLS